MQTLLIEVTESSNKFRWACNWISFRFFFLMRFSSFSFRLLLLLSAFIWQIHHHLRYHVRRASVTRSKKELKYRWNAMSTQIPHRIRFGRRTTRIHRLVTQFHFPSWFLKPHTRCVWFFSAIDDYFRSRHSFCLSNSDCCCRRSSECRWFRFLFLVFRIVSARDVFAFFCRHTDFSFHIDEAKRPNFNENYLFSSHLKKKNKHFAHPRSPFFSDSILMPGSSCFICKDSAKRWWILEFYTNTSRAFRLV